MDNFKNLEQTIEQQIDPNGAPGSILAVNHQAILKTLLSMVGKYTGHAFIAQKNATQFPSGTFSWNGNALNNTNDFTVRTSKKTADLNDFGRILNTMVSGDIIRFKDYVGRSVFLEYKSHTNALDANNNPVWDITVSGFVDNPNYIFQDNETAIAILSINKTTGVGKTYVDDQDNAFLLLAKQYTDEQIAGMAQPTVLEFALNHDVNLDFYPFMRWRFPGNPEFSFTKKIVLTSDPGLDKFVTFAGTNTGDIVAVEGTPSSDPDIPFLDPDTQIEGTTILIKAGATTPDGVSRSTIYNENTQTAGGEWNTSENTSGARINLGSTVTVLSGTKSIEGTNLFQYDRITFIPGAPIPIADFPETQWNIKNKYDVNPTDPFRIQVIGTKSNGRSETLFLSLPSAVGYDPASLDWQKLSFGVSSSTITHVTEIRFVNYAPDQDQFGMFLDVITFAGGTGVEQPAPAETSISVQDVNGVEQFTINNFVRFDNVVFDPGTKTITPIDTTGGGGGTSSVENRYLTIAELLANQGTQTDKAIQYVADATTDNTVNSGWAYYERLSTTTGALTDYRKLSEQESLDVIQSGGSTPPIENEFADITALTGNQGIQTTNHFQLVLNASADTSVNSGWAIYQKLSGSTGALSNYRKVMEAESMDDDQKVITVASSRLFNVSDIGKKILITAPITMTWPSGGIGNFEANVDVDAGGQLTVGSQNSGTDLDNPNGSVLAAGKVGHIYRRPDNGKLRLKGDFSV